MEVMRESEWPFGNEDMGFGLKGAKRAALISKIKIEKLSPKQNEAIYSILTRG
jgi:hypothetical protein